MATAILLRHKCKSHVASGKWQVFRNLSSKHPGKTYQWQSLVPVLRDLLSTRLVIPVEQGVQNVGALDPIALVDELRDEEGPRWKKMFRNVNHPG